LKTLELLDEHQLPAWSVVFLIAWQLILGLWLWWRTGDPISTYCAIVTFVSFSAYSFYLGWAARESCGCFGPIKVSPWFTLAMDLAMAFTLAVSIWYSHFVLEIRTAHRLVVGGLFVLTLLLCTIAVASQFVAKATRLGPVAGALDLLLERDSLIGYPFPLISEIVMRDGEDLSQGNWTLLLYHFDCSDCQQAIPSYVELGREFRKEGNASHVGLIELPPFGDPGTKKPTRFCHDGILKDTTQYFIRAPMEVRLVDGKTVYISRLSLEKPGTARIPGD
jgi:hypothetical protein